MACQCGGQRSSDEPQWMSMLRAAMGNSRDISALTKAPFTPVTINFNSFCSHPSAYQGRGNINDYGYMQPAVDAPFLDQRAVQSLPNAGWPNGDGKYMMAFANSLPQMPIYQHQAGCTPEFLVPNQSTAGATNGQNNTVGVPTGPGGVLHQQFDAASAFGFGNGPHIRTTHASPVAEIHRVPDEACRPRTCDAQMMNDLPSGDDPNNAASSDPGPPLNAGNAAVTVDLQTSDEHSSAPDFSSLLATSSPSLPSLSDASTACASADTILVSPGGTSSPLTSTRCRRGRNTKRPARVPDPQDRLGELDGFIAQAKKLPNVKPQVASNPVSTRPEWREEMQALRNLDQPAYFLLSCRELGLTYKMILPLFNGLFQTNFKVEQVGRLRTIFHFRCKQSGFNWMDKLLDHAKEFHKHDHFVVDTFQS